MELQKFTLELNSFELGIIAGMLHEKISREKKNPDFDPNYIKVFEKVQDKIRELQES